MTTRREFLIGTGAGLAALAGLHDLARSAVDLDLANSSLQAARQQHDFIIQHGADRCVTRIVGVPLTPAAVFDAEKGAAFVLEDAAR